MTSITECSDAPVGRLMGQADVAWLTPLYLDPTAEFAPAQSAPTIRAVAGPVTVVVPVYNEQGAIALTIRELQAVLTACAANHEIIIVDDGSTDGSAANIEPLTESGHVRILQNQQNRGYGFSLKRAIKEARYDTIVIVDADGTYPLARLPDLLHGAEADMVVGARIGNEVAVPLVRRPAKWFLRKLAEYLTATRIPDLNSGFRVMRRSLVERFLPLLPDGFSFTTTITLAALTHGYDVRYIPIDYAKRVGASSIRPFRDTLNFLSLIVRTVLYFKPLKVFGPLSAALLCAAVMTALISKLAFGQLADVTSVTLAVAAFDLLAIGLLADLIEKRSAPFGAWTPATCETKSTLVGEVATGRQSLGIMKERSIYRDRRGVSRQSNPPAEPSPLWSIAHADSDREPGYTFAAEWPDPFEPA